MIDRVQVLIPASTCGATQRMREERVRAAELKEERKRLRAVAAADAEQNAGAKKLEEEAKKAEEAGRCRFALG